MKNIPDNVKIYYAGELNSDFDKKIEKIFKKEGLVLGGSGYNLVKNIRDLEFVKK